MDLCRKCWEAFAAMSHGVWKDAFLSGQEQQAQLRKQLTKVARHLNLG